MAKNKTYSGSNPLNQYGFNSQVGFKGFIVGEAITVDGNDFILTLDSDNELSSTITMELDGTTLKLVGTNGKSISVELPTFEFNKVDYDQDTHELVFHYNDSMGQEQETRVNVEDLVDIYTNGEGLKLEDNEFSVNTDVIATVEYVNTVKSELETSISGKTDKSEIEDMLTKTEAAENYQPKGDYLT